MADSYKFGVNDAKIAVWNSTGSYGSLVDLIAINTVEFNLRIQSAVLEGDDEEVDSFGKIIGVTGRVRFGDGAQHADVLNVLLGSSVTSSGSKTRVRLGNENLPYWGLAFKVLHTDGSGDETHFGIMKAKIDSDLRYSASYGGYLIPEFTFRGVNDGSTYKAVERVYQDNTTALALPITF